MFGFLGLNYNLIFNFHTHYTNDGKTITHSHPGSDLTSDSSKSNHQHSKTEFINISLLTNITNNIEQAVFNFECFYNAILEIYCLELLTYFKQNDDLFKLLRSPPFKS